MKTNQSGQSGWSSAAILTIKGAARMTPKGRLAIAEWLEKQAKDLVTYGSEYSETLRSHYRYREEGKAA